MLRDIAVKIESKALDLLDDHVTDEAGLLAGITLILLENVAIDDD